MGVAFVALKRGRGQGGFEGASPQRAVTENPTQPPASFQCNPEGCKCLGRLAALLARARPPRRRVGQAVAGGRASRGYCHFARALQYGPSICSKGRPHLISGSLEEILTRLRDRSVHDNDRISC